MTSPAEPAAQHSVFGSMTRLVSGQLFALALPILAAPLLGHLYTPADYGGLALFMAATGMLSVVAALQMQHGIIAARLDVEARALVWLCVFLATSLALVVLATLVFFKLTGGSPGWLWLLPITVSISGLMAGVTTLANRARRYGTLARLQAFRVAVTVTGSIICGLWGWGKAGLFTGYMMGQAVNLWFCLRLCKDWWELTARRAVVCARWVCGTGRSRCSPYHRSFWAVGIKTFGFRPGGARCWPKPWRIRTREASGRTAGHAFGVCGRTGVPR